MPRSSYVPGSLRMLPYFTHESSPRCVIAQLGPWPAAMVLWVVAINSRNIHPLVYLVLLFESYFHQEKRQKEQIHRFFVFLHIVHAFSVFGLALHALYRSHYTRAMAQTSSLLRIVSVLLTTANVCRAGCPFLSGQQKMSHGLLQISRIFGDVQS